MRSKLIYSTYSLICLSETDQRAKEKLQCIQFLKERFAMGKIDEHIRDVLQSHKDELYERYHVESLSVFGSVSRGTARPDRDIDILVRYQTTPGMFEFLSLKQYLEGIVGRSVDLVTERSLKK